MRVSRNVKVIMRVGRNVKVIMRVSRNVKDTDTENYFILIDI